jgi:phosphoadenosine phosphosulfate reductase
MLALSSPETRAERVLDWATTAYAGDIVLACSFGGSAGMVLLDMLSRREAKVPVFYLDTGLLFEQTHDLIEKVRERYGIEPIAVKPQYSVAEQALLHGPELWKRDPDACCAMRKVEPNAAFLSRYRAWITGIRRDQTESRAQAKLVEWGSGPKGLAKINPLADWSNDDVMEYLHEYRVPYNVLLDRGYTSLGCKPCTRYPVREDEARSGRWAGFEKTECGIHLAS